MGVGVHIIKSFNSSQCYLHSSPTSSLFIILLHCLQSFLSHAFAFAFPAKASIPVMTSP